jgi:hypothetical protein
MMRRGLLLGSFAALSCFVGRAESAGNPLVKVSQDQLCVTEGQVSTTARGMLSISAPAMRAVVPASSRQDVEARFAYLGPTDQTVALGSGALREQFGLKLRAADPCNLVYAMWRFAPAPGVVVQVKSNPAQHESQTCHNSGYGDVRPSFARKIDAPVVGRTYRLKAEMESSTLAVKIDGSLVWQGRLDSRAVADAGPVGVRSDNAKLSLTLFAPIGATPANAAPVHCEPSGED